MQGIDLKIHTQKNKNTNEGTLLLGGGKGEGWGVGAGALGPGVKSREVGADRADGASTVPLPGSCAAPVFVFGVVFFFFGGAAWGEGVAFKVITKALKLPLGRQTTVLLTGLDARCVFNASCGEG